MQIEIKPIAEIAEVTPPQPPKVDRVILLLLALFGLLALLNFDQAVQSGQFVGKAVLSILPYFLLAILFAAYARATGLDQLISAAFSRGTVLAIFTGSLAGALSPFCSCGVIPLIATMLAAGVPLSPVMAFCISSPIMSPEMFLLTAAGISHEFAVAKTAIAIGMGLFSGFAVLGLERLGYLGQPLRQAIGCGCGTPAFAGRQKTTIVARFWESRQRRQAFVEVFQKNGFFLGKWMTLAFFIESLMVAYLSPEMVANLVGSGNALAIPLAVIVGVPAYMNGYAAIPLISGLLNLGMMPGAAMAFMTAGAVSSIPAALAVFALVRRPVFAVYIGLGLIGSLTAGYVYQLTSGW